MKSRRKSFPPYQCDVNWTSTWLDVHMGCLSYMMLCMQWNGDVYVNLPTRTIQNLQCIWDGPMSPQPQCSRPTPVHCPAIQHPESLRLGAIWAQERAGSPKSAAASTRSPPLPCGTLSMPLLPPHEGLVCVFAVIEVGMSTWRKILLRFPCKEPIMNSSWASQMLSHHKMVNILYAETYQAEGLNFGTSLSGLG